MINALRLVFLEYDLDPPSHISPQLAAEFFGFRAADVEAVYRYRKNAGAGLWFRLKDGRVFDAKGNPCPRDPALYTRHGDGGFTLLELAIVILVVGVLTAGALAVVRPLLAQAQHRATEANMNRVIDVMSAYAQRNHRIPCPADPDTAAAAPYGAETGSGTSGDRIGDCPPGALTEGIVPFRTLGLNLDDIKDGYGRFLTYAVSPVFARDTTRPLQAHKRCRVAGQWVDAGDSRDPAKARFCCPGPGFAPATDLIVNDGNGDPLWPFARDGSAGSYDAVDVAFSSGAVFAPATDNATAVAFVLLSHGANGAGAFMNTGARLPAAGTPPGAAERENANGDNVFVWRRRAAAAAANFDDRLMWRTQDQIYAETGAGSCAFP